MYLHVFKSNILYIVYRDVGNEESHQAKEDMGETIDDLGASFLHDASPSVKYDLNYYVFCF